jgi:Icc-related predicted phosphoesterase
MRILAIGDFHGKIPYKLKKKIEHLAFDAIISPGDFSSFRERKLFFKYIYGKKDNVELVDIIGDKKYLDIINQNESDAEKVISYLSAFGKPMFVVTGNTDYAGQMDIGQMSDKMPKAHDRKRTLKFLKKLKISVLDFSKSKFDGFELIGYPRSSYPGILTKKMLKKKAHYGTKERIAKQKKDYIAHKKKVEMLIKSPEKTILLSHNVPYRTKLDKIGVHAHKLARNQHYGSALVKELIKKYQPRLVIAGHMHENPGKIRIGKTVVVNPGAAIDGRAAIITLTDKQVKVKFLKA